MKLPENIKNSKIFKKAKYIIFLKLVIKIIIVSVAFFSNTKTKAQSSNDLYFSSIVEFEYQNPQKSIEIISTAIEKEKRNVEYLMFRGSVYYSQNDYQKAISDFRKAEKIKPNIALLNLAKLYSLSNNPDSSIYYLKKYLSLPEKITKSEITLDKDFENIKNTEQWSNLWQKDYYNIPEKQYSEAFYLYNFDKELESLELLNQIIDKYKSFHKAYYLKALILKEFGNPKEAAKVLENALEYSKDNFVYLNLKAECYMLEKKWNNAIDDYSSSLKLNPYQLKIYYNLAICYYNKKMYIDALENIEYYTKFYYIDYDAIFENAKINYDAGNFLTTVKIMNKLLVYDPKNPDYYSLRGKALLNSNSFEAAFTDLAMSLDINPSYTGNYYYMGIANLMLDKTEEACADWKNAIDNKDYKANEYYNKHCKEYDKKINH